MPFALPSVMPTVGRIVHYTTMGADPESAQAAIVVAVHDHAAVDLQVFSREASGSVLVLGVPYLWAPKCGFSDDGRWTWPPHVGAKVIAQ